MEHEPVDGADKVPYRPERIDASYHGITPIKAHIEFNDGDFNVWTRYTRGGTTTDWAAQQTLLSPEGWNSPANPPFPLESLGQWGTAYQQYSIQAAYTERHSEELQTELRFGYDFTTYTRYMSAFLDTNREDKYDGRILSTWAPDESHSLALGFEYQPAAYGLKVPGYPHMAPVNHLWPGQRMPHWETDLYSILAEHQWKIAENFSAMTDFRWDKASYTDSMYSPRFAAIWDITSADNLKIIVSQAQKANFAEELRKEWEQTNTHGDAEKLKNLEAVYTHMFGEHLSTTINPWINRYRIISYAPDPVTSQGISQVVGEQTVWGGELEIAWRSPGVDFGMSHSYASLINFTDDNVDQFITSKPYGYGHDLANWSTNMTKLYINYRPVERLTLHSSLRVFYDWPGDRGFQNYANDLWYNQDQTVYPFFLMTSDPSYKPYGRVQARLNLGARYEIRRNLTAGVFAYNLLGVIDGDFNNRFYIVSAENRRDPVSFAATLEYKFS